MEPQLPEAITGDPELQIMLKKTHWKYRKLNITYVIVSMDEK
jgi:hypothetical protein